MVFWRKLSKKVNVISGRLIVTLGKLPKSMLTRFKRLSSCYIGGHVRDGACYVCWSFARAYDPKEILPHVHEIARYN